MVTRFSLPPKDVLQRYLKYIDVSSLYSDDAHPYGRTSPTKPGEHCRIETIEYSSDPLSFDDVACRPIGVNKVYSNDGGRQFAEQSSQPPGGGAILQMMNMLVQWLKQFL